VVALQLVGKDDECFAFQRHAAVVADHSFSQGTPHKAAFKPGVAAVRAVKLFPVGVSHLWHGA
jgi:hypothetical protein